MKPTNVLFLLLLSCFWMTSLNASSATTKRVQISENDQEGNIVADSARLLHIPPTLNNFKLLSQNPPEIFSFAFPQAKLHWKWFRLNESTGVVTLRQQIDREELCGQNPSCVFELEIYAVDQQRLLNLDIDVDDVNDNPPVFSSRNMVVNVSENALIGDVISLNKFLAVDRDIGQNSAITYSISPNPYFEIQQANDNSATVNLRLKVVGKLDHETKPTMKLTLIAEDNGMPSLRGSSQLLVRITDVNDNDPVFEKKEYKVKLLEDLLPGYVVTRVSAHDADSGESGAIRYFLSSLNKPFAFQLLKVDPTTGDVVLKEILDREVHDNLKILIEARDLSLANQRVGRTWLFITVDDVNDNFPVIDVNYIFTYDGSTVYVPEDTEPGTNIALVTAKDADAGKNGKVLVFIESISTEQKSRDSISRLQLVFNLTEVGFLSINKKLDREATDRYDITLKSCDHGSPVKCSSKIISVLLLDVNDHRPFFSNSKLFLSLPEDTPVHTRLTTITAFDYDSTNSPAYYKNKNGEIVRSPYGTIFYHIIDGDGTFNIDSESGELTLARPLDREKREKYEITVRAKDSGHGVALQSVCKIAISILDVNDNRPQFTTPRFNNVTYYATVRRKHVIVRIQAVDYDLKENGTVSYVITLEDGERKARDQLFVINNQSGELCLNMSSTMLNKSLGLHRLIVQARDGGLQPFYNTKVVYVIIQDTEELPTTGVMNLKISSPPSLVFIVITCFASVFTVSLIAVAVVITCKNKKKSRSYTCTIDEHGSGDWTFGTISREQSFSDSKTVLSKAKSIHTGSKIEKRFSSVIIGAVADARSDVKKTEVKTKRLSTEATFSLLEHSDVKIEKKLYPQHRHLVQASSSHDGDSGRGDSDPDAPLSEITNETGIQKRVCAVHTKQKQSTPHRDSQCTDQCLLYGHSDTCWMPQTTLSRASRVPSSDRFTSSDTLLLANVSTHSSRIRPVPPLDYRNKQSSRAATNSMSYHHPWEYPANALSAIYSDVIMNTRQQDVRYVPAPTSPLCHTRKDFRLISDGFFPKSSPSTSLGHYQTVNNPLRSLNRAKPAELTDVKRYSTSILSSPFPGSPLPRSSSEDLLDTLCSRSRQESGINPTNSLRYQNSTGELSKLETQEIIDNIEKLLNS